MKKAQKRMFIVMMAIPVLVIVVSLVISGISIKDLPVWAIIMVTTIILVSPFAFLLAQRSAQTIHDASLQKQKKRFLAVWSAFIIIAAILLIILYYINNQFFWPFLFIQAAFLFAVFMINLRLFFPKKKESAKDDNQNNPIT